MKTSRQLHLWIGLITSVFILIEAITGLLLSEPWLIGGESHGERKMPAAIANVASENSSTDTTAAPAEATANAKAAPTGGAESAGPQNGGRPGMESMGLSGFIKGLHAGRIGNTDLKIFVDITAVGMIILTVTGITLSVRVLRSQRIRKQKLAAGSGSSDN